jgi:hypothetical protein
MAGVMCFFVRAMPRQSGAGLGHALTQLRQAVHSGERTVVALWTSMRLGQAAVHLPQPVQRAESRRTAVGLGIDARPSNAP